MQSAPVDTCLILAAGEHRRFGGDLPKQLLVVNGEGIIYRTIRQLNERGIKPTVVTHKGEIINALAGLEYEVFVPGSNRWTCETLWCTSPIWRGTVLVLLGDVIFSGWSLNTILSDTGHLAFGTNAELFALKWRAELSPRLVWLCARGVERAAQGLDEGKLFILYRLYDKLPVQDHTFGPSYLMVDDGFSRDIDTREQYDLFLKELES